MSQNYITNIRLELFCFVLGIVLIVIGVLFAVLGAMCDELTRKKKQQDIYKDIFIFQYRGHCHGATVILTFKRELTILMLKSLLVYFWGKLITLVIYICRVNAWYIGTTKKEEGVAVVFHQDHHHHQHQCPTFPHMHIVYVPKYL